MAVNNDRDNGRDNGRDNNHDNDRDNDRRAAPREGKCRILFVCLGNICRSPTAEGVFRAAAAARDLGARFQADSAGTGDWHIGRPPDPRAQRAAAHRGIDLSGLRARRVCAADMVEFDYLLAMDRANHADLTALAGASHRHKVHLFLALSSATAGDEVPDPYYGDEHGFDRMLDLVSHGSDGLIDYLVNMHRG